MLVAFKTELKPTNKQKEKMNQTFGVCRFVYNMYIGKCAEVYETNKTFLSGYSFSKWLNNEFLLNNPTFLWIKDVGSKAVKKSIMDGERAFKNFFKKKSKFPRFKKYNSRRSFYFPKNNKTDLIVERHRIKIPTFGFVRLKEFGYIPIGGTAKSCTVSMDAGRYFISVLVEIDDKIKTCKDRTVPIGIDLGIKDLVITSEKKVFKNVNKTKKVKKIKKKLKREQRAFSRKLTNKKRNKQKSSSTNLKKNGDRVSKIHFRLKNIRREYVRYVVNSLVKVNSSPEYIVIEDLNVKGMLKNRHLSNAIRQQLFSYFREYLLRKCFKHGVELRVVDRFFPSSKTCHKCGTIKSNLKLSDRVFKCECGNVEDRDINASLNLRDATTYTIAS